MTAWPIENRTISSRGLTATERLHHSASTSIAKGYISASYCLGSLITSGLISSLALGQALKTKTDSECLVHKRHVSS